MQLFINVHGSIIFYYVYGLLTSFLNCYDLIKKNGYRLFINYFVFCLQQYCDWIFNSVQSPLIVTFFLP